MANENIEIEFPNFCLTSQDGTFGTIDTSTGTTRFRVINTAGGLIKEFTLSANIAASSELIALEYVGPLNEGELLDGSTYFTIERVNSTNCLIKRWELDNDFSLLNLKQQINKFTTGNFYYDVVSGAVEHYRRSFYNSNPAGINYLDVASDSQIENGARIFLGPSSDTDNLNATEYVTVNYVVPVLDYYRVYLNETINYQYAGGDPISFYNHIYLISQLGYGGDTSQGTLFQVNANTGALNEYTTSGEYKLSTGARWSAQVAAVASITGNQLMFIRPYDSYLKWKSMHLKNMLANDKDPFDVEDVVFDGTLIYKLAKYTTLRDDNGNKTTSSWSTYNYQTDSLVPYADSMTIYSHKNMTVGNYGVTKIYLQVRDQFGIGLRDVNLKLYKTGDPGAEFDPLNGQTITDLNGEAVIGYTSGGNYDGYTTIDARGDQSSPSSTGSQYIWNSMIIYNDFEIEAIDDNEVFQLKSENGQVYNRQINDPFKITGYNRYSGAPETVIPRYYLIGKSLFTTEGGDWYDGGYWDSDCWPWFSLPWGRTDGANTEIACEWAWEPWNDPGLIGRSPRPNYIRQVEDFTQFGIPEGWEEGDVIPDDARPLRLPQPLWYWTYYNIAGDKLQNGRKIYTKDYTLDAEHWMRFSQLKLSLHTHYVDGDPYDYLWTYVNLDQFVFVEDAIPGFWSEKNSRDTYIWIRLRPFAFNLNGDTLKFYVREVWTVDDIHYDTGYYDVVDLYGPPEDFQNPNEPADLCKNDHPICMQYFDAGGGVFGLEFLYKPQQRFHHNAIVYIHLELYDTAAEPNYIYTDYWFKVIPDYNSPYLENLNPDRESVDLPTTTNIYFEVKDDGEGVDIDTLEVTLNSRIIYHAGRSPAENSNTTITKISDYHYTVSIDIPYELQHGKEYSVGVKVSDVSESRNWLRDSYRFFTIESDAPWFTGFDPALCKRDMPRFRDVTFIVLGAGDGVDEETIRLQVHDKDVTDKSSILPILYRVS